MNQLLTCMKTWMDLKGVLLHEENLLGYIFFDSISWIYWKRKNYRDTEQSSGCQDLEIGERCDYKIPEGIFWIR